MPDKERPGFEEALRELESIVEKLSNQEITLEESVKYYEEGTRLSKICSETLESASLKIEQIDKNSGNDTNQD